MTSTFAELGLSAKVLSAIEAAGYPEPTPIQAEAIPVAVTGRDVLGIAQTGTGKTASFVLPMITRLETGRARARMPRSLILAPTRELAAQCAQSFEKYGINHKLSVALLIGGVSMDDQVQKLDRGVDVLIATPGRLLDHFGRGRIMLMGVEILVIDEADRMLDMGFIPDIEKICKLLPPRRQTLFFSATMPPEITRLVSQFLTDPVRIEVAKPATTAKTITQRFRFAPDSEDWAKREVLRDLLRTLDVRNAIIFCNRKKDVAILLKSLTKHGFNAGALHGDMDQMSRMSTLDKFRSGEIALLAASDVAARGLDIPDVSHVINFDVPWQADDYVHRIGRTGRAGKEGFSATIVTPEDVKSIESIAKLIGEEPVWIGEQPDEDTLAEGRSRKRGRGGRARAPVRGRGGEKRESVARKRSPVGGRSERGRDRERLAEPIGELPREPREPRHERAPTRDEPRREAREGRRDESRVPREAGRDRIVRSDRERAVARFEDQPELPSDAAFPVERRPERRPERQSERRPERLDDRREGERDRPRAERSAEFGRGEPREEDRGRPVRAERSERQERPDRSARPERTERPVRIDRPERDERAERAERPARPERPERVARPERVERSDRPERGRDRSRDRGNDRPTTGGGTPVGLGDHVPAFLRRPVRAGS